MEFEQVLRGRRAIRTYLEEPVPRKLIEELIEDATWAPSSCNRQLWHFIVVERELFDKELKSVCPNIWTINPPAVIFVAYDRRYNPEHGSNVQSVGAAIQSLLLSAHNRGLGSLWMTGYGPEKQIKRILHIPEPYAIAAAVCLGYSNQNDTIPARRPLSEVFHVGRMKDVQVDPFKWDPKYWSKEDIVKHVEYSVRAKSPDVRFYRPKIEAEFRTQVENFPVVAGRTLVFNPFAGNYLFTLMSENKIRGSVDVFGLSQEVNVFLENKRKNMAIERKVAYANGLGKMPYPDRSFDSIICAEQLEGFNKKDRREIVAEFRRVIKDEGKLYVIFGNSLSPYYVIWRFHRAVRRVESLGPGLRGPRKPMNPFSMDRILEGFKNTKSTGFGIFLKFKERYKTESFLRVFCRSILAEYVKER
ncbi:MAG: nitroreductase family protein [Deltaproteobacteria bacterium]|nr:nitroreductase family protein [Deltaproteobacteria bacterium]